MKMMKRVLALLLVFAMLMPNLTTIALAADTEESSVVNTEPVVVAEEPEETEKPEATETATEAPTEPPVEETEPPTEETVPPVEETEPLVEETEVPAEETEAPTEATEDPVIRETGTVEETVTSPVANEESGTELESETLTVEDVAAPVSEYSNDDMFAMYLERLMYPDKPSTLGTGGYDNLSNAALKNLYNDLKAKLKVVADQGGSTVFTYSAQQLAELGFLSTITAETMGITGRTDVGNEELKALVSQHLGIDLSAVVNALLADCPYELYWYDKLSGCNMGYSFSTWAYETGEITEVVVDNLEIRFTVADNYVGEGDADVTPDAAAAAEKTIAKAKEVRDLYKDLDDIEKIHAYKQWIMDEVCYDHEAADNGNFARDNDPWQLIYVFDGDSNTNVVCEGYAKAFQYLCDLSEFQGDVESFLVSGSAGGPHMWNIVSIEGRNYLVDVTNTDTAEEEGMISFGQDGKTVFLAGVSGSIQNGYTFTNPNSNTLTYTYIYEQDGKTYQTAIDVYGDGEDSS